LSLFPSYGLEGLDASGDQLGGTLATMADFDLELFPTTFVIRDEKLLYLI
jgi:hypothetical protein